jgi:hypothetical protein
MRRHNQLVHLTRKDIWLKSVWASGYPAFRPPAQVTMMLDLGGVFAGTKIYTY